MKKQKEILSLKKTISAIALFVLPVIIITAPFIVSCNKSEPSGSPPVFVNSSICPAATAGPDEYYSLQWHLLSAYTDVETVWATAPYYKGTGVTIAVVDDGIEMEHEDLCAKINFDISHNYIDGGNNISQIQHTSMGDIAPEHGTCVAGVLGAIEQNNAGVRGAAPNSTIAGFNLLQTGTSSDMYDAMTRNCADIYISNNSWGPADGTGEFSPSESLWQDGVEYGLTHGRVYNGTSRGIVYLWAAGNGDDDIIKTDNSNYDGFANYHGVIAVGAIGDDHKKSYYSEPGSNVWISTYSNGGSKGIATTDMSGDNGYNLYNTAITKKNYTDEFGGTSSATPLVSGIVALILEANPELSWRDVKLILAKTADKVDSSDAGWTVNNAASPYNINYKYGFGSVNAKNAVLAALSWSCVGAMETYQTSFKIPTVSSIPDNNSTGISDVISVSSAASKINAIEYIDVAVTLTHQNAADLEITLTAPSGTKSVLAEKHDSYGDVTYFSSANSFRFGTVRCLDESSNGNWTLTIKDLRALKTGTLQGWSLKFYGRN